MTNTIVANIFIAKVVQITFGVVYVIIYLTFSLHAAIDKRFASRY